jgi:hypothetical protein
METNSLENNQVPVYSFEDVIALSQERQAHIEEIKNEVQAEYDNINAPEPFIVSPVA